jgi:hypothetical protein
LSQDGGQGLLGHLVPEVAADGHATGFVPLLELPVAASDHHDVPTIRHEETDHLANLHGDVTLLGMNRAAERIGPCFARGCKLSRARGIGHSIEAVNGRALDELIESLPPVGHCEGWWDAKNRVQILKPDVKTMQACVEAGTLTDEQWIRALQRTGAIGRRSRWPSDVAFGVSMRSPTWMGLGRITLKPRVRGWNTAEVGEVLYGHCGTYATLEQEMARVGVRVPELSTPR